MHNDISWWTKITKQHWLTLILHSQAQNWKIEKWRSNQWWAFPEKTWSRSQFRKFFHLTSPVQWQTLWGVLLAESGLKKTSLRISSGRLAKNISTLASVENWQPIENAASNKIDPCSLPSVLLCWFQKNGGLLFSIQNVVVAWTVEKNDVGSYRCVHSLWNEIVVVHGHGFVVDVPTLVKVNHSHRYSQRIWQSRDVDMVTFLAHGLHWCPTKLHK